MNSTISFSARFATYEKIFSSFDLKNLIGSELFHKHFVHHKYFFVLNCKDFFIYKVLTVVVLVSGEGVN